MTILNVVCVLIWQQSKARTLGNERGVLWWFWIQYNIEKCFEVYYFIFSKPRDESNTSQQASSHRLSSHLKIHLQISLSLRSPDTGSGLSRNLARATSEWWVFLYTFRKPQSYYYFKSSTPPQSLISVSFGSRLVEISSESSFV